MSRMTLPLFGACLCAAFPSLAAQNLYGGGTTSTGEVPQLTLSRWDAGESTDFTLSNLPLGVNSGFLAFSTTSTPLDFFLWDGTLMVDLASAVFAPMPTTFSAELPGSLNGVTMFFQGIILEPGTGLVMTDATRIPFFEAKAAFSSGSQAHVLDEDLMAIVGSANGVNAMSTEFTPDRARLYAVIHGSPATVRCYDVTGNGLSLVDTFLLSGTNRNGSCMAQDGAKMWVACHDGISQIDTDPSSPSYNTETAYLPTPITGQPGTAGGSGPISVAAMPDNSKLFIAYGEAVGWPNAGTLGIMDLPSGATRSAPLTTGGDLLGFAHEYSDVVIAENGDFAYVVEFGVDPFGGFVNGFTNGGLVSVIETASETEILTIPTDGFEAREMAIDLLDKSLWIAHVDGNGDAEAVRIDIDTRSADLWTLTDRLPITSGPFASGAGPRSVALSADGSTLLTSTQGSSNPELHRLDTITGAVTTIATPGSWPDGVSIQRY